ncbi:hypothetical protein K227x_25060 [Rubripirellula lacrimiformis]|uniref:Uncharacterized protein n=1 Tax=Rubripirellula lacrimiformis TaxID=1930273 RepID=A0A517NAS7_9BACT|nr:hypothetical protein K227x_25060 [Rubripirellula lacrimiformis]
MRLVRSAVLCYQEQKQKFEFEFELQTGVEFKNLNSNLNSNSNFSSFQSPPHRSSPTIGSCGPTGDDFHLANKSNPAAFYFAGFAAAFNVTSTTIGR